MGRDEAVLCRRDMLGCYDAPLGRRSHQRRCRSSPCPVADGSGCCGPAPPVHARRESVLWLQTKCETQQAMRTETVRSNDGYNHPSESGSQQGRSIRLERISSSGVCERSCMEASRRKHTPAIADRIASEEVSARHAVAEGAKRELSGCRRAAERRARRRMVGDPLHTCFFVQFQRSQTDRLSFSSCSNLM